MNFRLATEWEARKNIVSGIRDRLRQGGRIALGHGLRRGSLERDARVGRPLDGMPNGAAVDPARGDHAAHPRRRWLR